MLPQNIDLLTKYVQIKHITYFAQFKSVWGSIPLNKLIIISTKPIHCNVSGISSNKINLNDNATIIAIYSHHVTFVASPYE